MNHTDEAQKAATVLSAVSYMYMTAYIVPCDSRLPFPVAS